MVDPITDAIAFIKLNLLNTETANIKGMTMSPTPS
jgi:hypothetical protein